MRWRPGSRAALCVVAAAAALVCAPVAAQKVRCAARAAACRRSREQSQSLTRVGMCGPGSTQGRTLVDELAALSWEVWGPPLLRLAARAEGGRVRACAASRRPPAAESTARVAEEHADCQRRRLPRHPAPLHPPRRHLGAGPRRAGRGRAHCPALGRRQRLSGPPLLRAAKPLRGSRALTARRPRPRPVAPEQDQVAALLEAGADPNSACQYVGQTPLYMAASHRPNPPPRAPARGEAIASPPGSLMCTPLTTGYAGWGRTESVKELLQRGADPARADRFGKNAFDAAAAAGGKQEMHQLLQQAGVMS